MEKAAFISDVHSNLEALDAVLAEIGRTRVYCLGDIVGYGASPNEVVNKLKQRNTISIIGNHDRASLTGSLSNFNPTAAVAVAWTRSHLDSESLEYLRALPETRTVSLGGTSLFMTHGSPDDNLWEYVLPETHSDLFDHYLERLKVKVLAVGHSHLPFVWEGRAGTVFNPGSVGQPRDGDPRAAYASVTAEGGRVTVELRRVGYDLRTSSQKILREGLPGQLASRLLRGL